jgi:hypothetical protein
VYFAVVGFDKKKKKDTYEVAAFSLQVCHQRRAGGVRVGGTGKRRGARVADYRERDREGRARDNEKTHYK